MVKQQGATIQRQTLRVTQTEMYAMRQWFFLSFESVTLVRFASVLTRF